MTISSKSKDKKPLSPSPSLLYGNGGGNASTDESPAWIGGPGTRLPRFLESFLCWALAIGCLSVSGYHYLASIIFPKTSNEPATSSALTIESVWDCWLPLTTTSRRERSQRTRSERLERLARVLQGACGKPVDKLSDPEVIQAMRGSEIMRRLATLAMKPSKEGKYHVTEDPQHGPFAKRLVHLWPRLLQLPATEETIPNCTTSSSNESSSKTILSNSHDISLIVPAFREDGRRLLQKLHRAHKKCRDPSRIQLVLVDAGHCQKLPTAEELIACGWNDSIISTFTSGGGRGPCLNHGASVSTGRILSFCHSDTELPDGWDETIVEGLNGNGGDDDKVPFRPTSCAFSFGIDETPTPGIKAVETTANWRTHLYALPYGDQCLSVPRNVYAYLGGVPDQCLMEDYELIALLRQRAALLPKFGFPAAQKERLVILPGPPTLCSPRRWEKFGVLYVTFTNSKCVNLYAGGMTPDDLFELYYGTPPPEREYAQSPWEEEMDKNTGVDNKKNA